MTDPNEDASTHPVFTAPPPSQKLWRYTDFTKFIDLLERRALFFAQASKLGDPFEGSVPEANTLQWAQLAEQGHISREMAEQIQNSSAVTRKGERNHVYVNCWYMNDVESAAMWRLYARTEEAVAVQTDFATLRACLPSKPKQPPCVYLGKVQYVDYKKDSIPGGNIFWPYVHKRRSYEHENELRGVIATFPMHPQNEHQQLDFSQPGKPGITIPVNVQNLIHKVYVAPNSATWFRALVEKLLLRYGINCGVEQSALDAEPLF